MVRPSGPLPRHQLRGCPGPKRPPQQDRTGPATHDNLAQQATWRPLITVTAATPHETRWITMRQPRLRTVLIAIGAAIAVVAGSTTAYAAIAGPVDGSGVIHGCYTDKALNGSHVIVLQDAGTTCPQGTTAISWNQQGPAGATGPVGPTGATGPAGPSGPAGATGLQGPKGDTGATGTQGSAGPQGPQGSQGPAGADGSTVLNGTGAPAGTLGHDGDFYLDTAADILYGPKASGTWPMPGTSLVGPAGRTGSTGPAGPQGFAGPQGPAGADGSTVLNGTGAPASSLGHDGDFYIDTAANALYGPKAGGAWPAVGVSLVGPSGGQGPQGPKGDTGAQGPQGPTGPPGPPGAGSLASLDSLGGLDCNAPGLGHGTVNVAYGTGGSVSLSCVGPYFYHLTADVTANPRTVCILGSCGPFATQGFVESAPDGISCIANSSTTASVTHSCTAAFAPGTQVTLNTAGDAPLLQGWTGACSGTAATCTVTMNSDLEVGATFG